MVIAAVGQICSTASMSHNLAQCQVLVRKAVAAGAKALFLPEASDYIGLNGQQSLSLCQPTTTSPFITGLRTLAYSHSLHINVGIHEPTNPPSSRLSNSLIWISPTGTIAHTYHKIHLFGIDQSAEGGPKLQESDTTAPGTTIAPPYDLSSIGLGKIGSMICFDLRFPEIAVSLRKQGTNVLLYPSAFTVPTGELHWEVLLRARAIENQCYVIAAAQCGRHNAKRVSYGDSIVIDPNGKVLGRLEKVGTEEHDGEKEGGREPRLLVLDLEDVEGECEKVRKGLPLLRRGEVYGNVS